MQDEEGTYAQGATQSRSLLEVAGCSSAGDRQRETNNRGSTDIPARRVTRDRCRFSRGTVVMGDEQEEKRKRSGLLRNKPKLGLRHQII